MKTKKVVLVLLLASSARFALAAPVELQTSFDSLLEAEVAFSKTSMEKGVGEAFDRFLMADAVLLRPTPEGGRKWLEWLRPSFGAVEVTWQPSEVVMSRSGDFAWVTGPWVVRAKDDPAPVKKGEFLSIWRRGPDGAWKVALDTAITGPEPEPPAAALGALKMPAQPGGDVTSVRDAILEIDRKVSAAALSDATLYLPFLSEDARFLRMFAQPVTGKAAIRAATEKSWMPLSWEQVGGDISSAGDMAYTYGILKDPAAHEWTGGSYLRIWERRADGSWSIAVDLANWTLLHHAPPEPPKNPG
jgi:ketosteroid isomerase-like protein